MLEGGDKGKLTSLPQHESGKKQGGLPKMRKNLSFSVEMWALSKFLLHESPDVQFVAQNIWMQAGWG